MRLFVAALTLLALLAPPTARAAESEASFKEALASAEVAEQQAARLKNRWIPTEQALAEAKKAAAAGDFDAAVAAARQAEALANASIAQAKEQEGAWHAAVIRN